MWTVECDSFGDNSDQVDKFRFEYREFRVEADRKYEDENGERGVLRG